MQYCLSLLSAVEEAPESRASPANTDTPMAEGQVLLCLLDSRVRNKADQRTHGAAVHAPGGNR